MLVDENLTLTPKDKDVAKSQAERMLRQIRHSHEFPGTSKYVTAITQKLFANPDSFDASELADMILNDYAMTSKLLRLANSVTYGFAAGKVTTVTRAVVILGYVYVRLISISLSLFEHFKSKHHIADLKEEMIRSLWSGMLAREIALNVGNIDSEEAFICAMLIRLGKLVMIRYFPDEYRKILRKMQDSGCGEAKAVKSVCATTYEALGMAVAKQWNFPEKICASLQSPTTAELHDKGTTLPKLQVLNSLITELNELIELNGLNDSEPSVQNLLDRHKQNINIPERQLQKWIRATVIIVEQHAQAMDFDIANSSFLSKLRTAFQISDAPQNLAETDSPAQIAAESFKLIDGMELKARADGQTSGKPIDIILDGVQEISRAMIAGHNVNDITMMGLEILYRSLGFRRALMFIRDSSSQMMTVRFGYGRQSRQMPRKVQFKIEDAEDLFNHAVQSGKDLIVADAFDPEISHLIPRWYRRNIDAPAFIFLPVLVQDTTIGALYADWDKEGRLVTDAEYRHLNILRNQLALAIRYRQGA